MYEDSEEPKLIVGTPYFKRIKLNGNTYILAIEYYYHDTLSVLYHLSVTNNKTTLNKIHTMKAPFITVHEVPGGVIYSGYNINILSPWAVFFDGETVQELEYLGEPNKLRFWNPDDDPSENNKTIRY